MAAVAVFTCRPASHPFQERSVSLTEPVKIGRSVARARPNPNNAIFDCKVLSRNHALVWYEAGKFYLQDTKSSNGTFINNQRLSKGSEESPPREVYSGDIVQFGVDVMENSRRVTHSCIIASIQLFHPDGREATNDHSSPFLNGVATVGGAVQSQELYQLAQYLQEALHREQMLENKLATLQRLVANTQEASESGWQALIDEDRLLSRLEVLENQLAAYSKNQTEDSLRQELTALQEDKYNYETTAKESLRRVLQEKLDAVRKLSDLERSLGNTEDECSMLREMCESSQKELETLAETHQEQLQEMVALQEKLNEAEKRHADDMEKIDQEKTELEAKLEEMVKQEGVLQAKVESLQADNDFAKEQLANMKVKMESMKEDSGDTTPIIPKINSQGVQVELINLLDLKLLQGDSDDSSEEDNENGEEGEETSKDRDTQKEHTLRTKVTPTTSVPPDQPSISSHSIAPEKLKETRETIQMYKTQLELSESRMKNSQEAVEKLQNELEKSKADVATHLAKITTLEETIQVSDLHVNKMVEDAVSDMKIQLNESRKQADNNNELAKHLKEQIVGLEGELSVFRRDGDLTVVIPTHTSDLTNSNSLPNHLEDRLQSSDLPSSNNLKEEIDRLRELLQEARGAHHLSESQVEKYKAEIEEVKIQAKMASEEVAALQAQLAENQKDSNDKSDHVNTLQDQLNNAESSTKEVKTQIIALRDQLQESQQAAKQSKNEAEQLRMRVKSLQEELEFERSTREVETTTSTQHEMKKQAASNRAEFTSLKEECANLRKRIQDIENEMKISRRENQQLQTDYSKLQDSYTELEQLKDKLENKEEAWKSNLTDSQKEAGYTKEELAAANAEIRELKDKCNKCEEEIAQLRDELGEINEENGDLSYRSHRLWQFSMIPLMILVFAIIMAFYFPLAEITATSTPT